jgi:tetratricopeptide (TPR) repeat protein
MFQHINANIFYRAAEAGDAGPKKKGFTGMKRPKPIPANRCDRGCLKVAELIHVDSLDQAAQVLADLADRCPACRVVNEIRGDLYYLKGDYESAAKQYSKAIEKIQPLSGVYLKRAFASIGAEDYSNAMDDLSIAQSMGDQCAKEIVSSMKSGGKVPNA